MTQQAGQGQAVDRNFPCGLCMSVLCIVLEDVRAFIGVGRLTGSKGSGHRLYREEELVPLISWIPRNLMGLEMVGSPGCKARG